MPTLAVARDYLFKLIGKTYSQEDFEKLCFEFGVELDDVTSEREMRMREISTAEGLGEKKDKKAIKAELDKLSDAVIYKIDTPANRYDLLSAESMAIALKVFLGMAPPRFNVMNRSAPLYRMVVEPSVKNVRDYVVCAVLKNIKFTSESYNSFIDFQDKLHSGLARKRTLASVGTHDLDKILKGKDANYTAASPLEFFYRASPKETISFVPLNQNGKVLNCAGNGLEEFYKAERHISKFIPLISSLPNYPTICDREGTILSLPPIINSDFSKIDMSTRNVFIECTATDHHKAEVLVNQMVSAFSWHCEDPFSVDAVEVVYPADFILHNTKVNKEVTPDMSIREMSIDIHKTNSRVGINITTDECAKILQRMYLYSEKADENTIKVGIPAPRSDILDPCDLIEDVAIAYGYDNIVKAETQTHSNGKQDPINKLSHLLRLEVACAGYTEMLNFSLCSRDEAFANLGREDKDIAVHIANPQTFEFQICRPSLLPGALKTFAANKSQPLPIKLFEVSDVVLLGKEENGKYHNTGCINRRHFCALHCAADTNAFEDIHGLVEYVMTKLGVPTEAEVAAGKAEVDAEMPFSYILQEGFDKAFFPGRAMDLILVNHVTKTKTNIGHLGVMHPNVLKANELPYVCSYCEIDIQHFI